MQEIHHFFHSLFSLTLDFRVRLFNILALGGTVISLIMALLSLGTGSWGNVLINLVLVAVSGGLFLYSYYSEKYQRCYLITIVMIFLIVFPVMFFTSGGYHGGMPAFFVFAIIFTVLMLEKRRALIVSLLEIILYIGLCLVAYHFPHIVTPFATEADRLALSLVPSDLGALLHSVEKDFSSHPSSGNNQLVLTIQPDLPEISADSERLIQVITNLISNAERHTQNGSITISLTGEPGWQTICVSDTGTGMSEEMRKNALKGYVSADKDYWRHGIGLYVCHQIITAHGGKIWLKSQEGEGTQVFFSLPEEVS